MFDFLFKRAKRSAGQPPKTQPQVPEQAVAAVSRRAEQIARAHTLSGDEAGALACILQSEFADVRLAAAQHVHTQAMMEQLHQAMRNTDRRVAKLMQTRLDVIRHEQAEQQRAQACIDGAARLLQDADLSPNQVAELDRRWQVIQAPAQLSGQFAALRSALGGRIDAQVALQRAVIDAVAGLRQLAGAGLSTDEAAFALGRYASEHAVHGAAFEARSLPRQLLREFASALQHSEAALADIERQQGAVDARQAALTQWQGSDPAELNVEQVKRSWQNLPSLPSIPAALQQQFDTLIAAIAVATPAPLIKPKQAAASLPHKDAGPDFTQALDAMEAALQQGLLQVAAEHDKMLHDSKGSRLTPAQSERLAHVRAEFKRLADWARWGGNVSREELVKAVEELPALALPNGELAKKIGSLRACWKSLDGMSGAAPKALWLRFDAACELAYAPVAAHFRVLADERHANAGRAQALIAEILSRSEGDGDALDWKSLAAEGARLRQAWTRLGTIDRKEKKQLDGEFGKALDALLAPLEHQRQIEMARREQLIVEVGLLQANQRNTTATLRALQEKWQEYAKALPLERHAEQALWQRFRAACDQVFAQRKESASIADGERRIHLHDKEAVCAGLEAADGADREHLIPGLLRDAQQAWNAIGAVPHANEQKIAQRYQAAVALLQSRLDASARRAEAAQVDALQHKLRLCQALETALCSVDVEADRDSVPWTARWSALPPLGAHYEAALLARFAAAVQALDHQAGAHALQLERNRGALLAEVLRLEIAAGIDSGAEFARERLKMQVEALQFSLQSSLQSGQKQAPAAQFLQLCALPALADTRTASRIEQLLKSSGAMESR